MQQTHFSTNTDLRDVSLCQNSNDSKAFERLFTKYTPLLKSYAKKITWYSDEVSAISDVNMMFYDIVYNTIKLHKIKNSSKFSFKLFMHFKINRYIQTMTFDEIVRYEDFGLNPTYEPEDSPEFILEDFIKTKSITEKEANVIVLKSEGYKIDEIAKKLKCTRQYIYKHLRNSKVKFKEYLHG